PGTAEGRQVGRGCARLQSLSWFMKCLKEPLSRLANREEQTRGASFEGRFNSVAILDEESLLATCAYIDLNPVAAGGDGNGTQLVLQRSPLSGQLPPMPRAARKAPGGQ